MTPPEQDLFDQPQVTDFHQFETDIYRKHQLEAEQEIMRSLTKVLSSIVFIDLLRRYASARGYRYEGLRKISVRLASGTSYPVKSPLFVKARPKSGRRRKNRKNVCEHFGLSYLGFDRKDSPVLVERSVTMATLCPSFEIACKALEITGTELTQNRLRRIAYSLANGMLKDRAQIVVDEAYRDKGLRLLICVDGGKIRERINKKGRRRKGSRMHGFYASWREPRLITICLVDENGKKLKGVDPIYDGTIADHTMVMDLIGRYLEQINVHQAESITFCADGAQWIWTGVNCLIKDLKLKNVNRVLDYTHAKQNLKEIVDLIHQAKGVWKYQYEKTQTKFQTWLWQGDVKAMEAYVNENLKYKREKKAVLKKLREYFGDHEKFQYQQFKAAGIPTGSGMVESAIRRIINMRIKGCGLFWLEKNAEIMIFLRSQVLSNRLRHCMKSKLALWRNRFTESGIRVLREAA